MIKLTKIIFFLAFLFYGKTYLFSQANEEWVQRYSGIISNSIDGATGIVRDKQGYIFITGESFGTNNKYDFCTIKYSPSGIQQWVSRYNGLANGNDLANAMTIDNEGNIIVTGESEYSGSNKEFLTIKYSSSGQVLWIAKNSCSGNSNYPSSIVVDSSDNIYISGKCDNNLTTIKYDSSGVQKWITQFQGTSSSDATFAIALDDSNNVYVTGEYASNCILIKYDSSGVQKWVSTYNGNLNQQDFALAISIDPLNNIYICGSSIDYPNLYGGYLTIKYNSNGVQQWVRIYEGSGNFIDIARSMKVDKFGNVYVTGYSTESGQGYNFTTIKYNTNGDTLWKASYNNGLNDIAKSMDLDTFGNSYIVGGSDGNGTGDDYAIVKYDSSGNQKWVKRYNYSGQFGDYPQAIAVDNSGSVYVTGSSNRDYLTIKYSQLTGINTFFTELPKEFKLEQNYPNPFNPSTVINYELRVTSFALLKIYDIRGNEIAILVNEKKSPGSYSVEFDGRNISSGIYFYRLESDGNIIDTKRMLLLK